jgi:transketolase
MLFSRQGLPHQPRTSEQIENIRRGGYILFDSAKGTPEAIILATGSEVAPAVEAAKLLGKEGRKVRVVSMPSTDVFDAQDTAYRQSVLPEAIGSRVAVEAGVSDGWYKYVGLKGKIIGIDRFGESAPADELFTYFGFTVDNIANTVRETLG